MDWWHPAEVGGSPRFKGLSQRMQVFAIMYVCIYVCNYVSMYVSMLEAPNEKRQCGGVHVLTPASSC